MPVCRRCDAEISEEDKIAYNKLCHRCYILIKDSKRTSLLPGLLLFFLGFGFFIFAFITFRSTTFGILIFIGILALIIGIFLIVYYLNFINNTHQSDW